MKIIAFTGPGGAGKNTAAEALQQAYQAHLIAFADPLYKLAAEAMGISVAEVRTAKESGSTIVRTLLEKLGDALRESLGEEHLIDKLIDRIRLVERVRKQDAMIVITDLRTEEEATWVRCMGGFVVHVHRTTGTSNSTHATNRPIVMEDSDGYLLNDGTVDDLHAQTNLAVTQWLLNKEKARLVTGKANGRAA